MIAEALRPLAVLFLTALLLTAAPPRRVDAGGACRVAVLEFDNASAGRDLDPLGKGLQSMLTTDLGQVPQLELVERARLADVQAELKLGKSGALDPKTAARLGKLAGATHLLAGTFTVVGERMRIDARLFAVEGGQVLLAEKGEGEKDAFFELEKTLVSKLVDALGVKLRPKERAEVSRVHTADFEAFRSFSRGVALFDEKRYQEAVAALRDATGRDKNFQLAQLTLAGYEQLLDKMRAETGDRRAAEDELKRLGQRRQQSAEAQVVERLWEVTRRAGKGKDGQLDRLAATYELALAYGDIGNHQDRRRALPELGKSEDHFAMQRTGDALCQSYYAEALRLFPEVPPIVTESVSFGRGLPSDPDKAAWLVGETRRNLTQLGRGRDKDELRYNYLRTVLADPEGAESDGLGFMARLHLDMRGAADFRQKLLDLGLQLPGSPETVAAFKREALRKIGRAYRTVLALDRSTAAFTLMGKEGDSQVMASATREIELNRDLTKLLQGAAPWLRELLQLKMAAQPSYPENTLREAQKLLEAPPSSPAVSAALADLRRFPRRERYVLLGPAPAWPIMGTEYLVTGPRDEPLRAAEVRYHRGPPKSANSAEPSDAVLVLGGQPGRELDLRLEVSFRAPPDFWPPGRRARRDSTAADGAPDPGRPEVGVLFGLRDLEAGEEVDPKTGQKTLRPLRGGLLLLREGAVAAGEIVETERKRGWGATPARTLQPTLREERRADLRGETIPVSVRVAGGAVKAQIAGQSYSFSIPAEAGFVGLLFRGAGYAAVRKLSLGAKP